ncbi:D-alanine--D-alanine ligase [Sutcliffiella horikoshii]|uniref:D-alanine--D-alanine ligase n=1 Tax=Sutcliffiella horikoshii TaxID=79883 RepID=A0A5D4SQM1_9BACI|nr:D-alanine--D-alanine ligase [Sutcliffiella horikoshii]TYS64644.1 D-alanine--D-alanine ligase [Sutcliffiella horikoshii]
MKTKLHLLYGGKSAEHQVSLQTALAVTKALDTDKFEVYPLYITETGEWKRGGLLNGPAESVHQLKLEESGTTIAPLALTNEEETEETQTVVFPLLHGPNGEDGTVQGMLELLNLPYVGNGVLASSAGMDKVIMKNLFDQAGLPQVGYAHFLRSEWEKAADTTYEKVESELGYPCFVKPANLGSSVGISKAKNREELETAFREAFDYDRKIIVEQGLEGAREIEIGVLGNDEPECSVIGEIAPNTEFYDYKAKYEDGDTAMIIPAEISEDIYEQVKEMAITAFKAIDGAGLVRADFFLTKEGKLYINEVNTMPGFTPFSMFPLLWQHTDVSYPQLIEKLVGYAQQRHEEKQKIKHTF